ncbi:MAG: hypothetical protein R2790_03330 [Flavobacterium haoranii]
MSKFFLLKIAVMVILITGCEKTKESISQSNNESNSVAKEVILTLEFKNKVNDIFKVYYSDDPTLEITGENVINKYVFTKGNDFQIVEFKFPIGEKPYKLRLDLGVNQSSTDITIKDITIKYDNKIIDGNDGLFLNYWGANQSLVWNNVDYFYSIVPYNGSKIPTLISNPDLDKELLNLFESNNKNE